MEKLNDILNALRLNVISVESAKKEILKYYNISIKRNEICTDCGTILVIEDGCYVCKNCGFAKS